MLQECCLYPHLWVRSAAARVLGLYLGRRDPLQLANTVASATTTSTTSSSGGGKKKKEKKPSATPAGAGTVEALTHGNALYHLARRLCVMLDQPTLPPALFASIQKGLVWTLRAMHKHPQFSRSVSAPVSSSSSSSSSSSGEMEGGGENEWEIMDEEEDDEEDNKEDEEEQSEKERGEEEEDADEDEDEDEEEEEEGAPGSALPTAAQSGSSWAMTRLRGLGVDSRGVRRENVLSVFLALCQEEQQQEEADSVVLAHKQHLVETGMRARLVTVGPSEESLQHIHELADSLLTTLERVLGSTDYIELYSQVQRRVEGSKQAQRKKRAAEAVSDPQAFARRKVEKQIAKKQSRKRKKEKKSTKGDKRLRLSSLAYNFEN
jgi:hypothetical protein